MAKTETGWTKEYPSLKYGSWFFLRHALDAEPELHQLTGGRKWMESFGIVRDTTEFLGPVTASDLEQLTRLRDTAKDAAQWIDELCTGKPLTKQGNTVLCALREVLTQRAAGGES